MMSNPPIAGAIRQAVAAMLLFLFCKDYWRWGRTAARFDGASRCASKRLPRPAAAARFSERNLEQTKSPWPVVRLLAFPCGYLNASNRSWNRGRTFVNRRLYRSHSDRVQATAACVHTARIDDRCDGSFRMMREETKAT
jgi:hypothetical protein